MQSSSTVLTLARALFAVVGIGALLMAIGNLTSGQSLSDPVMPGGLALGGLMVGAAAWVDAPGRIQAAVVWLGIGGAIVAIVIFASFVVGTPSADVVALVGIPSLLILAGSGRLAVGRVAAGALGRPT